MPDHLTRRAILTGAFCALAAPSHAALRPYRLVREQSEVTFLFTLSGVRQTGTVPVASADIQVDPANLVNSRADVSADIRGARTSFIFITQALLGESVLDASNHPIVRFRSRRVRLGANRRISNGARLEGDLTLRGVTRPVSLEAQLSRPAGTAPDDLSQLNVALSGNLDRRDFGAAGYPELVAPRVDLKIRAVIRSDG